MFSLADKTALVTGASGGIGGAIVRALHAQGAAVILTGRRADALNALADELGERTSVIVSDLSTAEGCTSLMQEAGAVDIIVNNAGITRDNLAMRMKEEEWQAVLDTNLSAAFRLIKAGMRPMMKKRTGRIINITSVVGVTGNPGQANYAAAKAGMIGMSKALAQEIANRGITVNCVAPGMIESAMTDALNETQREAIMQRIPSGRLGLGSEVAAAVAYLASDEAGYVTGQTLHINGGMAMI